MMAALGRYWYLSDVWARSINLGFEMDWQQYIPGFGMHLHYEYIHIVNTLFNSVRHLPTKYDAIIMIMTYALYSSVNTQLRYASKTSFEWIIQIFHTVVVLSARPRFSIQETKQN